VTCLLWALDFPRNTFCVGKTMLFLRADQVGMLEKVMNGEATSMYDADALYARLKEMKMSRTRFIEAKAIVNGLREELEKKMLEADHCLQSVGLSAGPQSEDEMVEAALMHAEREKMIEKDSIMETICLTGILEAKFESAMRLCLDAEETRYNMQFDQSCILPEDARRSMIFNAATKTGEKISEATSTLIKSAEPLMKQALEIKMELESITKVDDNVQNTMDRDLSEVLGSSQRSSVKATATTTTTARAELSQEEEIQPPPVSLAKLAAHARGISEVITDPEKLTVNESKLKELESILMRVEESLDILKEKTSVLLDRQKASAESWRGAMDMAAKAKDMSEKCDQKICVAIQCLGQGIQLCKDAEEAYMSASVEKKRVDNERAVAKQAEDKKKAAAVKQEKAAAAAAAREAKDLARKEQQAREKEQARIQEATLLLAEAAKFVEKSKFEAEQKINGDERDLELRLTIAQISEEFEETQVTELRPSEQLLEEEMRSKALAFLSLYDEKIEMYSPNGDPPNEIPDATPPGWKKIKNRSGSVLWENLITGEQTPIHPLHPASGSDVETHRDLASALLNEETRLSVIGGDYGLSADPSTGALGSWANKIIQRSLIPKETHLLVRIGKIWQRKYIVLDNSRLSMFESKNAAAMHSDDCKDISLTTSCKVRCTYQKNSFSVEHHGFDRSLRTSSAPTSQQRDSSHESPLEATVFTARSEAEMQEWLHAIDSHISKQVLDGGLLGGGTIFEDFY